MAAAGGAGMCPPAGFSPSGNYWMSKTDGSCVRQESFFGGQPFLDQWVGYVIVLGFGLFFSVLITILTWLEERYVGLRMTSEFFNTAGRSIKTGLTASVIVSSVLHLVVGAAHTCSLVGGLSTDVAASELPVIL
ncbi:hypothetical protein CBR_g12519 [Chara braunii]|uniref:Uncharacterized protein n=1 Tax=Chara braunii TaxID=69332 RepID=A0A388JSL0_CHABU|nr:hypothetical protein CBR_g12519 [Chara braunii]|eukprot:GBG60781.1 hypothetical protein CBR_g12519 [Chara braunii]